MNIYINTYMKGVYTQTYTCVRVKKVKGVGRMISCRAGND